MSEASHLRMEHVPGLLAGALVLVLGFDQGGFAAPSWVWSAAPLAIVAGALFLGHAARPSTDRARLPRGPRRPASLDAPLVGLVAGPDRLRSRRASDCCSTWRRPRRFVLLAPAGLEAGLLVGVLVALAVLCLAGLADAAVGDDPIGAVTDDPGSEDRLAEPVGYANGMAVLAAMGTLLAVGLALAARRPAARAQPACCSLLCSSQRCISPTRGAGGLRLRSACSHFCARMASLDRRIVLAACAVLLVAVCAAGFAFARSFAAPTATPAEGAERLRTLSGSSRGRLLAGGAARSRG